MALITWGYGIPSPTPKRHTNTQCDCVHHKSISYSQVLSNSIIESSPRKNYQVSPSPPPKNWRVLNSPTLINDQPSSPTRNHTVLPSSPTRKLCIPSSSLQSKHSTSPSTPKRNQCVLPSPPFRNHCVPSSPPFKKQYNSPAISPNNHSLTPSSPSIIQSNTTFSLSSNHCISSIFPPFSPVLTRRHTHNKYRRDGDNGDILSGRIYFKVSFY